MTTCYQWFSFPDSFSVKCPKCGSECKCTNLVKEKNTGGGSITYVAIGEPGKFEGDLSCLSCGLNVRRTVYWPEDAFWKFDIKGKIMWAWSLEHSKDFLGYIQSTNRNSSLHYRNLTLHLPKHFKLAKNRKAASKAIKKFINENR